VFKLSLNIFNDYNRARSNGVDFNQGKCLADQSLTKEAPVTPKNKGVCRYLYGEGVHVPLKEFCRAFGMTSGTPRLKIGEKSIRVLYNEDRFGELDMMIDKYKEWANA